METKRRFPLAIREAFGHDVEYCHYKGFADKKNNTVEELWRFKGEIPTFRTVEQAKRFFTIRVAMYNM